ncbi:unnamed protein product, partial [Scytosiphon promiscuus]
MQVYIGPGQYFVTSDIGRGRMQWYSFLALPPGSKSREDNIQYLKDVRIRFRYVVVFGRFDGWSPEVHEALDCTSNNDVEQRDLYDRPPSVRRTGREERAAAFGGGA